MKKIYIIHENNEWTAPLLKGLDELGLPYEDWFLDKGVLDLSVEPPEGVFYNRMSASSHTRNHRYAPEYTGAVIAWLERHGRKVINSGRALQLEISKVAQYTALNAHGIRTPKTIAAVGKEQIMEAAKKFSGPFITKHNRAGKGLGVQLFQNMDALKKYVEGPSFEEPIDGITLIQEYIQSDEPFITRCEFIGRKFLYAVRVDTSQGFQLCPADACQIGDAFCPVGEIEKPKFEIIKGFTNPILEKYEKFLEANGIHISGIEFIMDKNGEIFTYDVNTNTNYNPDAEMKADIFGMKEIARYLGEELHKIDRT
ncbi:ATP-grasp domain-containing protein [Anaerosolibacter sp.]|uniref:ATP-grasp domain-containing protein n=1 Tax=Anaerosolibacter sp. TaxID=1872527 RepID=UPI0039F005D2